VRRGARCRKVSIGDSSAWMAIAVTDGRSGFAGAQATTSNDRVMPVAAVGRPGSRQQGGTAPFVQVTTDPCGTTTVV
jgi:hypothetical protein